MAGRFRTKVHKPQNLDMEEFYEKILLTAKSIAKSTNNIRTTLNALKVAFYEMDMKTEWKSLYSRFIADIRLLNLPKFTFRANREQINSVITAMKEMGYRVEYPSFDEALKTYADPEKQLIRELKDKAGWTIESRTTGKVWKIVKTTVGYECSCPGFLWHRECFHIQALHKWMEEIQKANVKDAGFYEH